MGNLCSNVRPRYKIYVIGVFDGRIDDLCDFATLYPNQLPRIGRYLLKQLNIRIQQNKSRIIHKDIKSAMQAWNDLIYCCNKDIEKFESHVLQSMILLFAQQYVQLYVMAMKTLRKYLPHSLKMSVDELLSFVDSCLCLAESPQISIRIDALKTLSVIFTHLDNSSFCPDLYTKYERIIHAILQNMDNIENNNGNECNMYAEHCYEVFCSLISTNTLSIMLKALSSILTEHYSWSPTIFVIKLLDILRDKGSAIEAISIVHEILYILSSLYSEDHSDETFVEYIDRLNTMDSMIITLQSFSSRVISKNGTRQNRNPIISKLCSLLHIIDELTVKTDSMDISTERILKFARNLLDCIEHYVIDISYIDSQSVLLRMIKYLSDSKSYTHLQLQLKCILRTIAHRTGTVRSSQHTQDDILKYILAFHLKQQYQANSDDIMDLLQLSIQNLLLLSHDTNVHTIHRIGTFNERQWAMDRVQLFLESQIKYKRKQSDTVYSSLSQTPTPASSSSSSSSMPSPSNSIDSSNIENDGFAVYKLGCYQREWLYATIYSYLESNQNYFDETTFLRITYTIIIIAISPHNFRSNEGRKIHSEIIDFEVLLPFLMTIQKLADTHYQEFVDRNKDKNENDTCNASVYCHSVILSVLLYIQKFVHYQYSRKTNYNHLFLRFCQIIDSIYSKERQSNEIFINLLNEDESIDRIQIEEITECLTLYFELIHARRVSISTKESWSVTVKKEFPVILIINSLLQESIEPDLEPSLSGISQSLLTPSHLQQRYVHSTASFDDRRVSGKIEDGVISNQLKAVQCIQALDELTDFQDISNMYCSNVDCLDRLRLSVVGNVEPMDVMHYPNTLQSLHVDTETPTQTKTFTFSEELQPFFEARPSAIETRSTLLDSDLSHFYIEFQNQEHASSILHQGLCDRLNLMDLDAETQADHALPTLEHELNELNYEYTQKYSQYPLHHPDTLNSVLSDSIQSPMRQLKAKGKSAVIHIRNRTRQLTQQTVRHIPNFKNTPNAIREKTNAIREKTNVIREKTKEKFQTVKTKMFKPKKESLHADIMNGDTIDDIEITMVNGPSTDNLNFTNKGVPINYQSANENSFSLSAEQEHSMSYTPSKGSVNTI